MATDQENDNNIAENLEMEITCAICQEHYTEPKVLPCCHYYCKQCILQLTLKAGKDKPFPCPECRQDITLPQGDVDHLQTAFFVNNMQDMHSKLQQAHGKVEARCELCSRGKAEAFCRQCTQFICAECVTSHQRMKTFSGHKTVSLDKLKEGGVKEMIMQESPLRTCKEHDEPMKIYCFTCSCLICRDCTVIDHINHNYEFIKKAASNIRSTMTQHLEPLKNVKVSLSLAVEEIRTTTSEIETQGDFIANEIESSFEKFHKIIDKRKKELLKEVAGKVTQKLENLAGQKKSMSAGFLAVQSVIEYTEQCVEHSTDNEVVSMHDDIQSRIDRETKEHHEEEGRSLEPVEDADLGVEVSCAEDLHQLFQTKAKILQVPIECSMNEEKTAAEVSKMSELSLIANLSDGKSAKRKYAVDCQLKSLHNGSIVKCNVDLIKGNEYRIRYTPTVRGRHELIVTAKGQEVAGSPFPVFVSIHPTELSNPVRVITGVKRPGYVAINSVGELIVTEPDDNKDVVVMSKEGERLRSAKELGHDINIKNPTGVAVDDSDTIFLTDLGGRNILKLSNTLQLLDMTTVQDSSLWGVAVVRDEVMVCDIKNNAILVYTKELKYVREIKDPVHFKEIRDISTDEHGNLYVCDFCNSHIHVLSNGGEYQRSFQISSGAKKFGNLRGICVANQHIYVANWNSHKLSVWTIEGEYVTSFGQCGKDVGDVYHPCGVCVDKDGFVYVCDIGNNRVQVF